MFGSVRIKKRLVILFQLKNAILANKPSAITTPPESTQPYVPFGFLKKIRPADIFRRADSRSLASSLAILKDGRGPIPPAPFL